MRPKLTLLFGLVLAAVLVAAGGWAFTRPYQFYGTQYEPPMPAEAQTLTDQHGQAFSLADFSGPNGEKKVALIFFGYTQCPDVCPITLADFKRVKAELGAAADGVSFVFVTVDPERDTPETISTYLDNFDPDFTGLTGTVEAMEPVWSHFGVFRAKQESGSAAGYTMDHSARTYLVDADGSLLLSYAYGTEVEKIAADIRYLLKEAE